MWARRLFQVIFLMAVGRTPHTEDLGLEEMKAELQTAT